MTRRRGRGRRRVEQQRPRHPGRHPDEPRRAQRAHAGVRAGPGGTPRRLRRRLGRGRRVRPGVRHPRGYRRADQRRGPAVGPDEPGVHPRAAAAGGYRGASGRVHRASRDRDRQRPGTGRAARVRRGAGGTAPGSDAGGRGAPPEEVFAAVAAEAGRVLAADVTGISRYDPDGMADAVGGWAGTGDAVPFPVGTRVRLGGRNVVSLVFETGRPARFDRVADVSGHPAAFAREHGFGSVVGAPITVEGRLWGVIMVISTSRQPLPPGTEARLAGFTELTATAIANAQARVELRGFAEEQAALRRVATLVVRAAPWEEVFAAVAAEAGQLLSADATLMSRYDPDDEATV